MQSNWHIYHYWWTELKCFNSGKGEKICFEKYQTSFTTLNCWLNKASCTSRLDGCRSRPNDTTVTEADEICLKRTQYKQLNNILHREVLVFFGDIRIPLKHSIGQAEGSLYFKIKLSPFSRFNTIPAGDGRTDRQTDRHRAIANTSLAWRHMGKKFYYKPASYIYLCCILGLGRF